MYRPLAGFEPGPGQPDYRNLGLYLVAAIGLILVAALVTSLIMRLRGRGFFKEFKPSDSGMMNKRAAKRWERKIGHRGRPR